MKRVLKFILRFIFFWLIVFFLNRIIFLLTAASFFSEVALSHILRSLAAGWLLDLSTIGYLLPIPGLLVTLGVIIPGKWSARTGNFFVSVFIVIYCLICFGELFLYREWTTKLTMQALLHFKHPAEVFRTSPVHVTFLFFFLSILFSAGYIYFYVKKVALKAGEHIHKYHVREKILTGIVALVFFAPLNFLMIRGGWSAIPISDSDAYYSSNSALNDAAVNPLWSLSRNILEYTTHQEENPYVFMSGEEATAGLRQMLSVEKDSTEYFLSSEKPNVVFLILEGFSSYLLPHFGGDNFAPFLDGISRQGIAFTKCYAAAYASDQGIPAVLSAYPSTPKISITNQSSKTKNLPCISRDLKPLGYESGFIFGGQLNYGNIKSYLYNAGFDKVLERDHFPESTPDGHLGIQDGVMVPLALAELNKAKEPFLYAWFTVSTHSPYDIDVPMKKLSDGRANEYLNTVVYSDEALRNFFTEAKKQSWYQNTLFVVVSDHSHFCQREFGIDDKEYHRIVAFFYGDVIKPEFRGRKCEAITSQLDLAPTVVKQFGLDAGHYAFGKNIMNPYAPSFAYFDYHNGSGLVTDSCYISRRDKSEELLKNTCGDAAVTGKIVRSHESFLQKTFEDYLSR
jgi:phosphoglycerol transferase MdoB-like AlkP superfamily enzyme